MPDLTVKLYTHVRLFSIKEPRLSFTLDATAIRYRQRHLVRKHLVVITVGNKERR
jgi:hypothetical protein